ncbi:MAG: hypothetical protein CMJ31_04860 [Phycisphaerae bacterium]|nr:hypothetical protein [Phycisphaerae bacterium]
MSIQSIDPEILQDFLTESGELLDQLEGDLVELEHRADDTELLNQVFRALHTIKGSASFLALTNLVEIAHAAETALNSARNHEIVVDAPTMDLLLRAVDILKAQFEVLSGGSTDLPKADDEVVHGLIALGEGGGTPAGSAADSTENTSAPAPTDPYRTPLTLGEGKADLLELFIADLDQQLENVSEIIDELSNQADRDGAAQRLGEGGDELTKTVRFFDHEPMLRLTRALLEAGAGAVKLESEELDQLLARVRAVHALIDEQTKALGDSVILDRPCDTLIERLNALASGQSPDADWIVDPTDGPSGVFERDAVPFDKGDDEDDADAEADEEVSAEATAAANAGGNAPPTSGSPPAKEKARERAPAAEQTIRVEVARLEKLMNLVGELVLQKNRIGEIAANLIRDHEALDGETREHVELASGALDRVTGDIQTAVMRTRMQPLDKLFGKYPRLIRDLAGKTGKKIKLEILGGETEVDRSVIEELGDPLVHLMRNSADHGLEPPEERLATGKGETGTIKLSASQAGDHVVIRIADDGRGLNRERIAAKALEQGLTTEAEVAALTDAEVGRVIFLPGFSTASEVSDLSGRGVGMDVVRTNIEKLKGSIDVSTTPGNGTVFTITIPLTVAIMPAMMVLVADETYAVPLGSIIEIVKPTAEQRATIVTERVLRTRGSVLPLLDAARVFKVADDTPEDSKLALVLNSGDKEIAVLVTRVIGQQEIVIKPLDGVEKTGPVSGATVRNDGRVSLIMDVAELVRRGAAAVSSS